MKLKSIIALLLIALCVSLTTLTVSAADVPSVAVGDLNGDGNINTTDVVLLRRYIAGGYDVELVPPTPVGCDHNIVTDPAVAPTCTVTGLTEGKHCSKCGEVLVKQEVVPAGHNLVNGVCTICGAGRYDELIDIAEIAIKQFDYEVFSSSLYAKLSDRIKDTAYIPSQRDVEDVFEDTFDSMEDAAEELADMTYTSVEAGKYAIWEQFAKSYLDAANAYAEVLKEYAIDVYTEAYERYLEDLEDRYNGVTNEKELDQYYEKLAIHEDKLKTFLANIEAIPTYTYEQLFDLELAKKYDPAYERDYTIDDLKAYVSANGVSDNYTKYVVYVISGSINMHLSDQPDYGQYGLLGDASMLLTEDLLQFRDRLDPTIDDSDIYSTSLRGTEIVYINGENYKFGKYYSNTYSFEKMVGIINEAITSIRNIHTEDFEDVEIQLITPDSNTFGSNNRKKNLYWVNEQARDWFYENVNDYAWLVSNETGNATEDKGMTITNNSKTGDFITLNNTGIPVTYTRTAEQQAILEAQTIYANAFNDVHQMIITLDTTNYANAAIKKITGSNEFKAIRANVRNNAELLAEIDAYTAVYTDKITSLAAEKKYGFNGNSFKSLATTSNHIDKVGNGAAFTFNDIELVNAENYNHEMVVSQLQSYVDKFAQTFYMDESRTTSAVVELWNYRNYTVQYITDVINSYKNRYETIVLNGVTHINQLPGVYYAYDLGLQAASAKGLAFEAQLDELLAAYTAKIMAVKLNTRSDVKDYYVNKIYTKASDWAWNFETARRLVNAYVVDLLGREVAGEFNYGVINPYSNTTYTAPDGMMYNSGDSRVFNAFKSIYLEDYNAYIPAK